MMRLGLLLVVTLTAMLASGRPVVVGGAGHGTARTPSLLYLSLALTMIALGLQGFIGHVGAKAGAIGDGLVLSEALHLIAAGLWLGALPPLWLSLWALSSKQAMAVCERFSPIGLACVLVLAGSGFTQGQQLIGSVPGLFGTTYGQIALLKIALFLLALVFAGINRLWLTDCLGHGAAPERRRLMASVAVETMVGLTIVFAAGFLASSVPAEHEVPLWPFSWQFSLITVNEDPEFRREVLASVLWIGTAVTVMAATSLAPLPLARLGLAGNHDSPPGTVADLADRGGLSHQFSDLAHRFHRDLDRPGRSVVRAELHHLPRR